LLKYIYKIPSYDEYNGLKKELGWKVMDKATTVKGLNNSIMSVCVYDDEQFIGMGRIVGDGGMVFVISNMMIKPSYHGQGIGKRIMGILSDYLDENCTKNTLVMLMARKGTEAFYESFGFIRRPSNEGGAGMCKYY